MMIREAERDPWFDTDEIRSVFRVTFDSGDEVVFSDYQNLSLYFEDWDYNEVVYTVTTTQMSGREFGDGEYADWL